MRVFIVDDSEVVVERLADLLDEVPGVELAGRANDVPGAIHSILKTNPDVIILDLLMPGGSGLEVLRTVRQSRPSLRVLVCTNYPYPQYREECLAAGANYFLDKSAEFEKISDILRDLIKNTPKNAPAAR
jgi:DNA-binding NarL/FixJ family response regulator